MSHPDARRTTRRRRRRGLADLAAVLPNFRPGAGVPGATAPFVRAPAGGARRRIDAPRLRRSLRAGLGEGMVAEVVTAFSGGAVLTGWGLHLGFGPLMVGLLAAFPFVAQVFHLPAAWLTATAGRRPVALWATTLARVLPAFLALPAFFDVPLATARLLLLAVAAASAVLAVIGNNAWLAWMGDLVPAAVRGRFFGGRMSWATLAGTVAALGAGLVLDAARPAGATAPVLGGLALLAGLVGSATLPLLWRQHDPGVVLPVERFDRHAFVAPLRDPRARAFLRYQAAWNASIGIAASFFAFYMLAHLRMGFVLTALYGAVVAGARIAAAPLWGRAIDRVGARPVLALSSLGIAFVPLVWLFVTPDRLWPLALEAVLAGILWSGQNLAAFDLPLEVSPAARRPYYVGAFAGVAGLAFAAGTGLAGVLAEALPARVVLGGQGFADLQVLFMASALARLAASGLAFAMVRADAGSVRALLALMGAGGRRAFGLGLLPARRGAAPLPRSAGLP